MPKPLANAATYSVAGDCDSSITDLVNLTLSDEDSSTSLTEDLTCANQRFSVELDVSAMRSDFVAISVSHRTYRASARVANNMVLLSFNALVEEFNLSTASNYNLSGKCDSSLSGNVVVSVIGTNITESTTCDNDNTFTVDLNASSVTDTTLTFQATYGNVTVPSNSITNEVPNEMVSLGIDTSLPPINLANAATYSVAGDCDSLITDLVNLTLSDEDSSTSLTEDLTCANQRFSVELDVSAMRSDFVAISVSHRTYRASARVANNMVLLSFNTLVEEFNSSTASNYNLSGKCDSSLSGNVVVSVIGTNITESTTCENDNTFTVDLNASSVTGATLNFQATYGNVTVPSNSITNTTAQPQSQLQSIQSIDLGDNYSCALTISGEVKCWGDGANGRLGNGVKSDKKTPVDVHTSDTDSNPLSGIAAISVGNLHACVFTTNEGVKCWGKGEFGRLGNGAESDKTTPVDVHTSITDTNSLSGITAISVGGAHTCALTASEGVKCWGQGTSGKLGNGTGSGDSSTPVDVHTSGTDSNPLSGIAAISIGGYHSCALTTDNKVKCWGYGGNGQLGNGAKSEEATPVDVHTGPTDSNPLSSIKSISSGTLHTCALTTGNKVKCWGYGTSGQLGNRAKSEKTTPVDVHTSFTDSNPLSDIAAISSGKYHTCALTTSEQVKCWGQGASGKLGNGATTGDKITPVDVHTSFTDSNPLSGIAAISAGRDHTCALTTSEGVKCWGKGGSGQLGNGAQK